MSNPIVGSDAAAPGLPELPPTAVTGSTAFLLDLEHWKQRALFAESKLGRVAELARQGRETSQFTHARAALDEIIKLSEPPR